MNEEVSFDVLKGKTITKIDGLEKGNDVVTFYCTDGSAYQMFHSQSCCECVEIEDVCGDVDDLIGSEILVAEEIIHENENPECVEIPEWQDSFTWTFYKLATRNGFVDIRWYGSSNGYYSESVDFKQIKSCKIKEWASKEFKRTERGWASHFICADRCMFHRSTLLEFNCKAIVVSTVGRMKNHRGEWFEPIGYDRYFETMVFFADDTEYHDADVENDELYCGAPKTNDPMDEIGANNLHEEVVKLFTDKLLKGEI